MYKALQVGEGKWAVFWVEGPGTDPRPIPKAVLRPEDEERKWEPYTTRQAAYRRVKRLNDLLKKTDEQIKRDGAMFE